MCIAGALLTQTPYRTMLSDNASGLGLLLIALSHGSMPGIERLSHLGRLAFGIYLSHLMFVEGLQSAAARIGVPMAWWLDILVFFASTVAAVLTTWILSRFNWGRWLMAL